MGQSGLVDYGIQNEHSHIRAHVCPVVRRVYVYKTQDGIAAINTGNHRQTHGYQDGVTSPTASGYLVPPFEISGCVSIAFAPRVWKHKSLRFSQSDNLKEKGAKAECLIRQMLVRGLFPIAIVATKITSKDLQMRGGDIIINSNFQ